MTFATLLAFSIESFCCYQVYLLVGDGLGIEPYIDGLLMPSALSTPIFTLIVTTIVGAVIRT